MQQFLDFSSLFISVSAGKLESVQWSIKLPRFTAVKQAATAQTKGNVRHLTWPLISSEGQKQSYSLVFN